MSKRTRLISFPKPRTDTWDAVPAEFSDVWQADYVTMPYEVDSFVQARLRDELGALIKVWHDDVRRPPDDSWVWCRDNTEVMTIADIYTIDVLSMDHDLGGSGIPERELTDDADYLKLDGPENGVMLAEWLAMTDNLPLKVTVHSMNPVGAKNILAGFIRYENCVTNAPIIKVEPFSR